MLFEGRHGLLTAMRMVSFFVLAMAFCFARLRGADRPLRISEFSAAGRQGLHDEDGDTPDWIEVQNVSEGIVNLQGWGLSTRLKRREGWRFPATNLAARGFLLVFASGKDRAVAGQPLHTDFRLRTQGGSILLISPDGEKSGVTNYPTQVPGISFGLPGRPGIGLQYFHLTEATPGRSNAPAVSLGPRVDGVLRDDPTVSLRAGEPVQVTARVRRVETPVTDVVLRYRVMFAPEQELPMFDDGAHGDGKAGDGVYGATIPAGVAQPGQMLRYCVVARDSAGNTSRWPLFANRPLYSGYEGTVLTDPALLTALPVVQLFSSRGQGDRELPHVAWFYRGELYDNVRIGPHGQISRGFPKASLNVDFPRDHPLLLSTNGARVSKLKVLGNFADKSKIRNTLSYEMIAAAGSIGHLAFPVRLQHNGKFFSVAELVEAGDERWLARVGRDPRGGLYKMNSSLTAYGDAEKKTAKQEHSSNLKALAEALSENRSLSDRGLFAYDHIDLPQCVSYLVSLALISSGDHGHKNYYLYHDSRGSDEWALFPWDVDLTWGRNWTGEYFNEEIFVDNPLNLYRAGHDRSRNRLYNVIFDHPEFRQMYLRRLRTVMDELLLAPESAPEHRIIERRIRELMNQLDPPGIKPSDAAMDQSKWPSWGDRTSMRQEAQRIIDDYLPGRRKFLFQSPEATLRGERIPARQSDDLKLEIADVERTASKLERFVTVRNTNAFAVDISGWKLSGLGVEHQFRPGTVIPAGKAIYAVANVREFRARSSSPHGVEGLFVQGNWRGELEAGQGTVRLISPQGRVVAQKQLN